MSALESLRSSLPDEAKDIKLNLQTLLGGQGSLSAPQRWGVLIASALATKCKPLIRAILEDARTETTEAIVSDARAAAVLMGMNNVYYRFRHMVGKSVYSEKPARLRMNRLVQPAGTRTDFELFSLAVSAINGCETCVQAHEKVVLEGGLTEDHVHDAVRLAATVAATAVAIEVLETAS